ncbi:MAG: hypothetical protein K6F05_02510 [Succinivibrio sp.]|nr:hypothetical protein [Succinivibrio sp.]
MKLFKACVLAGLMTCQSLSAALMWEVGSLTYPNGESEVSAFVNLPHDLQLQTVLCTKSSDHSYRFTLLLPKMSPSDMVIQVQLQADVLSTSVYGEISGNSLELQLDHDLFISLPDSTNLTFIFPKEVAGFLGIPEKLEVPMSGIDTSLRKVASECTLMCLDDGYQCQQSLVSAFLWPRDFYKSKRDFQLDSLCTEKTLSGNAKFRLSDSCRLALDRFYLGEGSGALSFLYALFHDEKSSYTKYKKQWNAFVRRVPSGPFSDELYINEQEWYLLLFSLISNHHIIEFPNSFYDIRNSVNDPTTLVYDVDSRYEIEALKYNAVLYRRLQNSLTTQRAADEALKSWADFYREFVQMLPNIRQAQALRPIIYRLMLMRLWYVAGMPQGITLTPEKSFRQGTNGKPVTDEPLERSCALFDGISGDEFYYASDDCVRAVSNEMRNSGLKTESYFKVAEAWQSFATSWQSSQFYSDSLDDAVGEHAQSNLALAMLSLVRSYGFGDYFLMRECISSEDPDICSYEAELAYASYEQELEHRMRAISAVSAEDARQLRALCMQWKNYYDTLRAYLGELVEQGKISPWRAGFVQGVAAVVQSNALLNISYSKEEIIDKEEIREGY